MPNPLFNTLAGNAGSRSTSGFQQMLQQFQQFKDSFNGDPRKEVEKLLQSGRISQQQLNQLQEMANQLYQLMN